MKVTKELVKKLASLAYLELDDKETKQYTKEIGSILDYLGRLKEVKIQGLEKGKKSAPAHPWREDKVVGVTEEEQEIMLKNVPDVKDGQFKYQPLFEDEEK